VLSPDLAAGLSAERFEEVQKYVAEIRQRLARLRDVEKR
jgi:hypothetical protein